MTIEKARDDLRAAQAGYQAAVVAKDSADQIVDRATAMVKEAENKCASFVALGTRKNASNAARLKEAVLAGRELPSLTVESSEEIERETAESQLVAAKAALNNLKAEADEALRRVDKAKALVRERIAAVGYLEMAEIGEKLIVLDEQARDLRLQLLAGLLPTLMMPSFAQFVDGGQRGFYPAPDRFFKVRDAVMAMPSRAVVNGSPDWVRYHALQERWHEFEKRAFDSEPHFDPATDQA
jgi:hypothetical protein